MDGPRGPCHERVLRVGASAVGVHFRGPAGHAAGGPQLRQLRVYPVGDLAQGEERGVSRAQTSPRVPVSDPAPERPDVCADHRRPAGLVPSRAPPEAVLRVFLGQAAVGALRPPAVPPAGGALEDRCAGQDGPEGSGRVGLQGAGLQEPSARVA
eukprot:9019137-Lingulodinium_polyedra.AAC.2